MDAASFIQQRLTTQRADQTRRRLRAIEGQVRGVAQMIADERSCLEVLVQIAAAQEALSQVNKLVMRTLVESYTRMAEQATSPEEEAIVYDDLMDILYKYRR